MDDECGIREDDSGRATWGLHAGYEYKLQLVRRTNPDDAPLVVRTQIIVHAQNPARAEVADGRVQVIARAVRGRLSALPNFAEGPRRADVKDLVVDSGRDARPETVAVNTISPSWEMFSAAEYRLETITPAGMSKACWPSLTKTCAAPGGP
jgi:hypothetical protein